MMVLFAKITNSLKPITQMFDKVQNRPLKRALNLDLLPNKLAQRQQKGTKCMSNNALSIFLF